MKKNPNILFLMCDQLQASVLKNDSQCKTSNFDYLMSVGTRFDRAYTPNAVCSPARASLMTGLLPHNHGVLWVTHTVDDDQGRLREDNMHWAQLLENEGYHTGYFGKWHIEKSCEVERYGWQVNGCRCEVISELYKKTEEEVWGGQKPELNYSPVKYYDSPQGYQKSVFYGVTDIVPEKRPLGLITKMALDYLENFSGNDDPWCCFVSIPEPHDPYICGRKAFDMYEVDSITLPPNVFDEMENRPNIYKKAGRVWENVTEREHKEAMACYYGSITEIDEQFGLLIKKVKEMGQLDNTMIILTTDHGEMLGAHGLYCKNISASEEVYNIPLVMSGPGICEGIVSGARVGLHDLCQTILELSGLDVFNVPDSRSFAEIFQNPQMEAEYKKGYAEYFGSRIMLTQRIVWDGSWKFVFNGFDYDELYDLDDDPYEMNNLIDDPEYENVVKRLCKQMWDSIRKTNDYSLYRSNYPILRVAPFGPLID